jgi:hypothetical protein
MPSAGMLRCVDLVRTDISEEISASIIKVTRIGELETTLALYSSETSVLTRATRRNISQDGILHSHCSENLKPYLRECSEAPVHNPLECSPNVHTFLFHKLYFSVIFNVRYLSAFRRQVAVAQSVYLACALRATECVCAYLPASTFGT